MTRPLLLPTLATLLAAIVAGPAAAQGVAAGAGTVRPSIAAPPAASGARASTRDGAEPRAEALRSQLRRLVVAQEGFHMAHGTYTTDLAALEILPTPEARQAGPVVAVIFAGGRGWTGIATDRALPGRSCVMFVGSESDVPRLPATMAEGRVPTEEGVPVCDAPR